jgi:hypothetical protein
MDEFSASENISTWYRDVLSAEDLMQALNNPVPKNAEVLIYEKPNSPALFITIIDPEI